MINVATGDEDGHGLLVGSDMSYQEHEVSSNAQADDAH